MNNYPNLNKNDLHYYRLFLNQAKNGYNNKLLDNSFIIINNFIMKEYQSIDFGIGNLEDFIQECFAIIIKNNKKMDYVTISKIYNKLKNNDKIDYDIIDNIYYINYDYIFFKNFMKEVLLKIDNDRYKEILVTMLDNNDFRINYNDYDLTRSRINQIKNEIFRKLKNNNEFCDYYKEYIHDAKIYYEELLKKYSLKEFICNPKSYYRQDIKDLIKKYTDDPDSLSVYQLMEVLDILKNIRSDYYKYHIKDISKYFNDVNKMIFEKSL